MCEVDATELHIGLENGLVPLGSQSLPEPMLP